MSATRDIDLQYFRADNSFLWQGRDRNSELHYLITSLYLQRTDPLGLFSKLKEDGLFGAEVVTVGDQLTVSRDLLDSIVEIYFLERHLAISGLSGLSILDVGAGYGRLAHRMVEALPELGQYLCVDAIAISTFISEYYLCFRGVGEKAKVIPLFDIEDALSNNHIDIAVNIHSFSEIPLVSIRW